jgi:pterin-4a-carbinolamine dehydratase
MRFGNLPVVPRPAEAPVVPMDRWKEVDGALYKTYRFRLREQRNAFVESVLQHEQLVGHSADIYIEPEAVSLRLQTHDLGKATELDKEFAYHADLVYKDVVLYSPDHGDEG